MSAIFFSLAAGLAGFWFGYWYGKDVVYREQTAKINEEIARKSR